MKEARDILNSAKRFVEAVKNISPLCLPDEDGSDAVDIGSRVGLKD